MNNVQSLDFAIALGGYGAGLALGCLSNLVKTKSLVGVPKDAPHNVSYVVQHLEVNRDRSGKVTNIFDFIKPRLWSPFFPLEHLAPLSLLLIGEVFKAAMSNGATSKSTVLLAGTYTFKVIVLPVIYSGLILLGGLCIRFKTQHFVYNVWPKVDPSGHALAQTASAVYKFFVFSALSNLNMSSNLFRMTAAVTTLSDYLWTYRTASSYHSVMDMMVSTLWMGISFSAVYSAHKAFV